MDIEAILTAIGGLLAGGAAMKGVDLWLRYRKDGYALDKTRQDDAIAAWVRLYEERGREIAEFKAATERQFAELKAEYKAERDECRSENRQLRDEQAEMVRRMDAMQAEVVLLRSRHGDLRHCWFVTSLSGFILDCGGTEAVLGYRPTELVTRNVDVLIPDDKKAAHDAGMKRLETTQKVRETPVIGLAAGKDGRQVHAVVALRAHTWEGRPAIHAEMFALSEL